MCGRFAQYRAISDYYAELMSEQHVISGWDETPLGRYNVMPQSRAQLLHAEPGGLVFQAVRWWWEPSWAGSGGPRNKFNARLDKVATSPFYRAIWPHRAIICADGWYEWVANPSDAKDKQPYFLRRGDGAVLFIPAVGQFPHPGDEPRDTDGFRMITDDAAGGMRDVHDRRPVVLSAPQAREWLDLQTSSQRAEQLLHQGLPADMFCFYRVSKAVSHRENGPSLILPIKHNDLDQ
ncbi:hypothetical protein HMPREF3289_05615 [Pseudomonas sp. HMSC75E02]|uniref:SOS response-associated peptidase n=1 Tax=Pseudomonas TaxID=286 RepID=UPI0008A9BB6B|nr:MULTISPECIES: SOS response-associated peptidase family protein [Pseudomonas]OHS15550.1 hypothetical protein HMPREF3289_05615 [Pseudomonas sp. HMSC75E02]